MYHQILLSWHWSIMTLIYHDIDLSWHWCTITFFYHDIDLLWHWSIMTLIYHNTDLSCITLVWSTMTYNICMFAVTQVLLVKSRMRRTLRCWVCLMEPMLEYFVWWDSSFVLAYSSFILYGKGKLNVTSLLLSIYCTSALPKVADFQAVILWMGQSVDQSVG